MPKYLTKKKKINLYKAYLLNPGDEMKVNENIDIFGLSYESAVQYMLYSVNNEEVSNLNGRSVCFAIFTIDRSYLDTHDLIDNGDKPYYEKENISITLKGKPYKMDVEEKIIDSIEIDINDKNEIKNLISLTLSD